MLIMLIGIPGSGKSTYAAKIKEENPEYIIHSSDELRKELFNSVSDQTHNAELFEELHKRIRKDLLEGHTVIYDATNLNKKRRITFLNSIKQRKKAVLFISDIATCKTNNLKRENVVPDEVIDKMRLNFCPPHMSEGFDEIEIIRDQVNSIEDLVEKTKGFDQENTHHVYTLDKHLSETAKYFSDEEYELKIAAYMHDIGKLFTKSKVNYDGVEDGNTHYYNHQNVGSYEFLCCYTDLQENLDAGLYIANLIYYHMHPYISWKQSRKAKNRDHNLLGDKMFNDIMRLHEADVAAH